MLSGRSATVESQPLPSLTQLLGSPGEAEVLLEQPQLFITGMRIFKRGRRSEVEYLMSFPAFPGQDDWYAEPTPCCLHLLAGAICSGMAGFLYILARLLSVA